MVKGDMCLKIMEKNTPKDVIIKEGEVRNQYGSYTELTPGRSQSEVISTSFL